MKKTIMTIAFIFIYGKRRLCRRSAQSPSVMEHRNMDNR